MSVHSTLPGSVDPAGLPPLLASGRPGGQDRAQLADWALAALADAEARMANLQARIAYLEGLSVTDELTGLFNRRGFANELSRALASARRGGPHGALLICDLDGFKGVNDRYGHAAGDDVLRQVARLLTLHVRRTDAVARLGGDEFALLLVGASKRGAAEKALVFRRLIGDTRFTHEGGEMSVAVSIGCAYYTGEEETEDDLFRRADAAMYADKRLARRGRPRLAVA
ncbi:MAG TPA: GGDEF domain-containing protein [Stellaceae bacterium]|nr:GGDEF domain-containing protein [Stellaceae bacterium]